MLVGFPPGPSVGAKAGEESGILRGGDPSEDRDAILRVEQDIRDHFRDAPWFDFRAHQAIVNIYRAAITVRNRLEQELLSRWGLTWGGFTCLWILWIWGEMESRRLAHECGVSKGTLTGVVKTLEKRGLVSRRRLSGDRRRVAVSLTSDGLAVVEELYPHFHTCERALATGLDTEEQDHLSRLLRSITRRAAASDLLEDASN